MTIIIKICCLLNPEYVKRIMVVQNSFSSRGRYTKLIDDPYENSFCPECVIIQKSKKTKCVITFKQIISNKIEKFYMLFFSRHASFKIVFIWVALSLLDSLWIPVSFELRVLLAAAHKCWDIRFVPPLPGLEFLSTFSYIISTWKNLPKI